LKAQVFGKTRLQVTVVILCAARIVFFGWVQWSGIEEFLKLFLEFRPENAISFILY